MDPHLRRATRLFLLASTPVLSSCAAVLGSKTAEVTTVSDPPGAEVYLDGNRLGTTPVIVRLPHKPSSTLVFKRSGYRDATCFLQSSTQAGWVILDVLFGLVPIVIDAATGDWKQISNKNCTVTLPPEGAVPTVAGPTTALAPTTAMSSLPPPTGATPAAVPMPPPVQRPAAALFQSSAPNEHVTEAARANRRMIVGDMLRVGTITGIEQGPVGILRTAVGETFHNSNTREVQYPKLALAYATWTTPGTDLVIELWEHGRKIGEFTDGTFFIGSRYSTPLDCVGPGPAGICGYEASDDAGHPTSPALPPASPTPSVPRANPSPMGHGGAAAPTGVPVASRPSGHRGLHFNLGLGAGAADLTCDGCDFASNTALSGYLGIGAAVGENTVLGVESTGWTSNEFGSDAKVYSLMATLTGYLNSQSGLFLTTGLGLVGYREELDGLELTATDLGFSGRLGYELRATGRLTFVPYIGFVSTFGGADFEFEGSSVGNYAINNLQAGLAVGIN